MSSIVKEDEEEQTQAEKTIGVPQDRDQTSAAGRDATWEGSSNVAPSTNGSGDSDKSTSPSTGAAGSDGDGSDDSGRGGITQCDGETVQKA